MIQETVYPRLKSSVSAQELTEVYTPSPEEMALAGQATRGDVAYLGFLSLLKTFQRLGYFVPLNQVPKAIVEHIATLTQTNEALPDLASYDFCPERPKGVPSRNGKDFRLTSHRPDCPVGLRRAGTAVFADFPQPNLLLSWQFSEIEQECLDRSSNILVMTENTALQELVLTHRKTARLSRQELAAMSGVSKTVIFDIEHGKDTIRLDTLARVLECLNIRLAFESPLMGKVFYERG